MLVLSRKTRESVIVGGGGGLAHVLKVTVLAVVGGKVKLGFDVAADVPVHRQEVWERICAQGELNSHGADPAATDVRSG